MIRPAKVNDHKVCDILDLAQSDFLYNLFDAKNQEDKMKVFYNFFGNKKSRFALENIFLYEIDNVAVAACCAYGSKSYTDEAICGYLASKNSDFEVIKEFSDGEFYIDSIAILEDFRGRGILRAMLSHAENKAINQGYKKLSLITKTPEYYESFGFLVVDDFLFNNEVYKKMLKEI